MNGVSTVGRAGYGWCAYASRRAWAAFMPRIHASGPTPPVFPRGAVTPPATSAFGCARWIAAYAGLRSRFTYTLGDGVDRPSRWFGSFHTVQSRTNG